MTENKKVTIGSVYAQQGALRPARPAPPGREDWWLPIFFAIGGVGIYWLGLLIGSWIFNVLDWRLGRLGVGCSAGGAVLVALAATPQTKQLPKVAMAIAGVASGAAFLMFAVSVVPPGYWQLRAEFHRIPEPPGWTSRNEQAGGNSICFDVCKSIERELIPNTDDPDTAQAEMTKTLEASGYRFTSESDYGALYFRRGRFELVYSYSDGQPVNSVDPGEPPRWSLEIQAA